MLLKELRILAEAPVPLTNNNVCGFINIMEEGEEGEYFYVILYEASVIEDLENAINYILARGTVETDVDPAPYGSSMVVSTSAKKGYGPLLYDVMLSIAKKKYNSGIQPDRASVSPQARGVWDYYRTKRSDVKATPIDNILRPETPQNIDDAYVHRDEGLENRDSVDFVYEIIKPINFEVLSQRHREVLRRARKMGIDADDVVSAIEEASSEFVDNMIKF